MASWSATFLTRLHRYKMLLRRRWWIVVICVCVSVCYAAYTIMVEPPKYQSVARMMVKIKISLPEGNVYGEEAGNFWQTQMELMKCERVQTRSVERLKQERPELKQCNVLIEPFLTPKTSIFVIRATGEEPEYTQAYLDATMVEYMNLKKEMRNQSSASTLTAIYDELQNIEKELRATEEELFHFQRENNIVFLEEQGNSAGSYLVNLNGQLSGLKLEYKLLQSLTTEQNIDRQASQSEASKTEVDETGKKRMTITEPENEYIKGKQQLKILQANLDELVKTYQPEHPKVVKLREEIAQMEKLVEVYGQESMEQLENRKVSMKYRIDNLEKAIAEWEGKVLDLNRRMAEYNRIKSKLTRMQNLHEKLLSSMQNINVSKSLDQEILSIMEKASPAYSTKFGMSKKLSSAAMFGLVMAMIILLLIDRIDDRVNSLTELRDHFSERILGQIPCETVPRNSPANSLLLITGGRHHYAESFRNIRSSLFFMDTEGQRPKTLLITSASPGEGKSTAAANLAITMANAGSRVLLIDADLRRGILHRLFNIPPSPGFSDILSQRVRWNETVVTYATPGLSIIPRGSQTSNPGELFLSAVTDILLRDIRTQYDCVIFDSAPVLAADDTPSLAPKIDGVLFLMSASYTSARLAKNSLEALYNRQVKVLGLIFNRMDTSLPEYYYYQYNSYDPDTEHGAPRGSEHSAHA